VALEDTIRLVEHVQWRNYVLYCSRVVVIVTEGPLDLADLDRKTQKRIKAALDRLLSYPQAVDLKKLKGSQNMWRLRVDPTV